MLRELINATSFWGLMSVCIIFFITLCYLSALLSVYFFSSPIDKDHRELANTLISILSGGFSILLAFVIINTWNYLMDARFQASKEADDLAVFIRNVSVFPYETKNKLIEAAHKYLVLVRQNEWQAMQHGNSSPQAWKALEKIYKELQAYKPKLPQENLYYAECISNLNDLIASRRERLNKLDSVIPKPLKQSLIIGCIFLTIILGSMRGERNFVSIMPALLFSASLGFNLALALSFDYPYSGSIAVTHDLFYRGLLGQFYD